MPAPNEYGIEPLDRLVEAFRSLDGVGRKTAARYAFSVLSMTREKAELFAAAILDAKSKIGSCSVCFNISAEERCPICSDESRDGRIICVVEDARAVMAVERVRDYNGLYHVLEGALSPVRGINADKLRIRELLERVNGEGSVVEEVILATNPDVEGEATAMYLARLLAETNADLKISRIANGVPVGGDLEYADELTLFRALEGRRRL